MLLKDIMSVTQVNNSNHALSKLVQLYNNTDLSDLVLKVGRRQFSTHKLILCMCSDVFKTMLTSSTWPESHSSRIILQEEPECADVFEDFLKYFYNGCISLDCHTVLPLLTLADKYNVQDLSKSCLEYMCTHCLPSSGGHIISWLQYSVICGHKELEKICRTFITYNFSMVLQTSEFNLMSADLLLSFLKSSDVVLEGEFSMYQAMKSWLHHQSNEDGDYMQVAMDTHFRNLFIKIMCHIRFPMMQLNQLAALETDSFVSHFKDFYLRRLFQAVRYHSTALPERQQMILSGNNFSHFSPRNYLLETWSTILEVENVDTRLPGDVHGAFFTTPESCSEMDHNNSLDWHINIFPRGVAFKKCVMIGVPRNRTVDECFIRTVRLSVTTNCSTRKPVEITVLIMGQHEKTEFVQKAFTKYAIFDKNSSMFNMDDILPYDQLGQHDSPFLIDGMLKLKIIIKPVISYVL